MFIRDGEDFSLGLEVGAQSCRYGEVGVSDLESSRSGLVDLDEDLLPAYSLLFINDSLASSARPSRAGNRLNDRSRLKYNEASIMDTTS